MKTWHVVFAVLFSMLWPVAGISAEKPSVKVVFSFTETTYTGVFKPDEMREIETKTTRFLIDTLSDAFGFLHFTDSDAPYRLVFNLDRKDPSAVRTQIAEVGFTVWLEGDDVEGNPGKVYWMLRPEIAYDLGPGEPQVFLAEISANLKKNIESDNFDTLVDSLFSHIMLSETALPLPEHSIWVMPFSKYAMALDEGTRFNVNNEFKLEFGKRKRTYVVEAVGEFTPESADAPAMYRSGILAEAVEEQNHLEDLRSGSEMTVLGVFIMKYVKGAFVEGVATPEEFAVE